MDKSTIIVSPKERSISAMELLGFTLIDRMDGYKHSYALPSGYRLSQAPFNIVRILDRKGNTRFYCIIHQDVHSLVDLSEVY